MRELADACGLSVATVSKAINPKPSQWPVADETRQKVLTFAKQLGYRPNFAGRSLGRGSVRTIGLYLAPKPWVNIASLYEGEIVRGVEIACREAGYDLLLLNMGGSQPIETCLDKVVEQRVSGLIMIGVEPRGPWLRDLLEQTSNVIFIDVVDPDPQITAMVFDNTAAVQLAVEHLVSLGHRRIGFLGPCLADSSADKVLRMQAFEQIAQTGVIEWHPEWVHNRQRCERDLKLADEYCQLEGYLGAKSMFSGDGPRPTALIAYADLVAVGATRYCLEHGIRIPAELSLVSVDDSLLAKTAYPPLTCIAHPTEAMGRRAVKRMLEAENGKEDADLRRHEIFKPTLVLRESTAPPR